MVPRNAPKRFDSKALKGKLALVQGCFCKKKNVCRIHGMPRKRVNELNMLTNRLSKWVCGLTSQSLDQCDWLLWFHDCTHDIDQLESSKHDTILLLRDVRKSPQCQRLVRCVIDGQPMTDDHYIVPEPPFRVTCSWGPSPLGVSRNSIRSVTSDELCMELGII